MVTDRHPGRGTRSSGEQPVRPGSPGTAAPRLVVLSGPSGVGKSTVLARLREDHPEVWLSVSTTTRAPRAGEVEGVHYFFTDDAGFEAHRDAGDLLEWAEFAGYLYGTPRAPVLDHLARGVPTLLEVDLEGARQIRVSMPEALLVFMAPPSWEDLVQRLVGRGTDAPDVVDRRLAQARVELAAEPEFDLTLVSTSVGDVCDRLVALFANPG